MSFKIKDDNVLVKYVDIWNKIKEKLDIRFDSNPVYDETYIKTKVKTFNDFVSTIFSNNKVPKESIHYTSIAAININCYESK